MRVMFIVNDLGVNEPFGPMILSAVLKEKGHETALGVLQQEDVEQKIAGWKPDILAYSMMSVDMEDMRNFNNALHAKKKIITILGGAHSTLDHSCADDPNIDAICVGEGEEAIVEVIKRIEEGKDLEGIPNILTSSKTTLDLRSFIRDVDDIPFMDRELVYSYPEMGRFGIKGIWTNRGCAFPCPYCFNNRYNSLFSKKGKVVRRRSVDSIIRETKELARKYRVAFVRIQDDVFLYKVDDWLKEFAERWSSEIGIPFYCLLRSELITDDMAYYLKKAGCFSICMSIESADDEVRTRMMRRKVSKEDLEEAFRIFKKHRINVYANTMLALPFTSLETDIESVNFAIKVQPEFPNFSIFMPYPGTDLGDYSRDAGIYNPDQDSLNYGMRNMSPLACFSEREKIAQYNLCQLAIVAVKFPILRNIIINHLIYWKPNKVFFFIHYFFAISTYGRKIFYFKHTLGEYVELFVRTMKHYLYDFTKKETEKPLTLTEKEMMAEKKIFISAGDRIKELKKCMDILSSRNIYSSIEQPPIHWDKSPLQKLS